MLSRFVIALKEQASFNFMAAVTISKASNAKPPSQSLCSLPHPPAAFETSVLFAHLL